MRSADEKASMGRFLSIGRQFSMMDTEMDTAL